MYWFEQSTNRVESLLTFDIFAAELLELVALIDKTISYLLEYRDIENTDILW